MKINNLDLASSVADTMSGNKKIKKSESSSFKGSYNQAKKDNQNEYTQKTLKKIAEQGENLKNRISLKDFMEYKSVVSEFMDYIVKNSHEYSKEGRLSRGGNYRVFGIIKKVNDELESLAAEFLKEEKDRFSIIRSVTGIQGMLVDMSM